MKKSALALILLLTPSAFAGYLIEPYFGTYSGNRTAQLTPAYGNLKTDQSINGSGMGLRAAYAADKWFAGIEYRNKSATTEANGSSLELVDTDLSLLVGGKFGGFRVYGGFLFDAKQDSSNATTQTSTTLSGDGFRFGVGYMFDFQMTLNVDYTQYNFKKSSDPAITNFSDVFSSFTYAPIMVSVGYAFGGKSK